MPHFTTFDNFASKAIVHPQYQEASKAIVHPQYQPEGEGLRAHPGGDGSKFMNPLDQMGFTNSSDNVVTNLQEWQGSIDKMPWDLFRSVEGNAKGEVSPSHQLDTEAIPCYTEFLKPADGEAGGVFESPHGTYLDTQPNDNLLGYPGAGSEDLTNSPTIPGENFCTGHCYYEDSSADALVQQVQHGCFEMQAGMDFNTSAFESLGADTIIKPQTDDALIAVVIIAAMQSEPGSETFI